MVPIQTTGRQK